MPRPQPFNNTELNDVELNARTIDVIGDLDSLNKIHFPNSDLVSAINAVPNITNKTFYIDQVNGSDNNDGSQSLPFKTLQKAFNNIPPGGFGVIKLLNDYICSQDTGSREKVGKHKYIIISGFINTSNGTPLYTLKNSSLVGGFSGILVETGTTLDLQDLELESNDNGSGAPHWQMLVKIEIGAVNVGLKIGRWSNYTNNTTILRLNGVPIADFEVAIGVCNFVRVDLEASSSTNLFFNRLERQIIFNYTQINDKSNGLVNIPSRGLI